MKFSRIFIPKGALNAKTGLEWKFFRWRALHNASCACLFFIILLWGKEQKGVSIPFFRVDWHISFNLRICETVTTSIVIPEQATFFRMYIKPMKSWYIKYGTFEQKKKDFAKNLLGDDYFCKNELYIITTMLSYKCIGGHCHRRWTIS